MTSTLRHPFFAIVAILVLAFALTGCESVEEGIEAGMSAAETVQELGVDVDGLLGEQPADAAAAKTAVAGALQEMAGKAAGDGIIMKSATALIRQKVDGWGMEGGDEIVSMLTDLESRLDADDVDVQATVDEVVGQLEGADTE